MLPHEKHTLYLYAGRQFRIKFLNIPTYGIHTQIEGSELRHILSSSNTSCICFLFARTVGPFDSNENRACTGV